MSVEFQTRLARHPVAQRSSGGSCGSPLSRSVAGHVILLQHQSLNQRRSRYHRHRRHSLEWDRLKAMSDECLDWANYVTYF